MAVTITAAQLREAMGTGRVDADRAAQLLAVATALVERYAPAAPDAVQNEAAVRTAGWIMERPDHGVVSERVGELEARVSPGQLGALRHSGAMGLLSPWKVRRAGAVG